MDLSQRALQSNGKVFKFQIRFRINGRKTKNIQTNSDRGVNIDLRAISYKLIDSS